MKGLFSPDSKFSLFLIKIGYLLVLSWIWLLFSLPVFTIGAASSALYVVIRKVLREEEGALLQEWWQAFRSNFKQSTVIWLISLVVGAIFVYSLGLYQFIPNETLSGKIVFYFTVFLLGVFLVWLHVVLAYVSRFQDKLGTCMRNALLMSLMNPGLLLWVAVQVVVVGYALIKLPLRPYLPLVMTLLPCGYCAMLIRPMETMFAKYIPQTQELQETK